MKQEGFTDRRKFLQLLTWGTAGIILGNTVTGCKSEDPEMLIGPVSALENDGELIAEFNDNRILARRNGQNEVVIFSLTCTHKQCTVAWKQGAQQFQCPCHEGKYDRAGKVVSGPPPRPLRQYKHEVRGNQLFVINEFIN